MEFVFSRNWGPVNIVNIDVVDTKVIKRVNALL